MWEEPACAEWDVCVGAWEGGVGGVEIEMTCVGGTGKDVGGTWEGCRVAEGKECFHSERTQRQSEDEDMSLSVVARG